MPRFGRHFALLGSLIIGGSVLPVRGAGPELPELYPNNRPPLLASRYLRLPLGAITAQGWLRDQLVVQKNGLTGHLPEVWDTVATTAWKGDSGQNVVGNKPFTAFMVPRWLAGLVPLAYQLDDPELKAIAARYLQVPLGAADLARVTPSAVGWATLGPVLRDYYEATGDRRALRLCRRILDYADSVKDSPDEYVLLRRRIGLLLTFGLWYYNQTGDADIPALIARVTRASVAEHIDYFRHFSARDRTAQPGYPDHPLRSKDHGEQGYELTEAIQYPVLFALLSRNPSDQAVIDPLLTELDQDDGQVGGRWAADEFLAGRDPTQGTELCDLTELSSSLENMFAAAGEVSWADRLEEIVFNGFPGTCMPDGWAHQYDQQANQVLVSVDRRPWHGNKPNSNIYGLYPNYYCCLSNMHSVYPRYIEHLWLATPDHGLAAPVYGSCQVKARVGSGVPVSIEESTDYPFSDRLRFTVSLARPEKFPLSFRIPGWAEGAELTIAGESAVIHPPRGALFKLERNWQPGDVVTLNLNFQVRTETRPNNAVSVVRGPLTFVLRIGESFQAIPTRFPLQTLGAVNWSIRPTTPWNYALAVDRKHPECATITRAVGSIPFAQAGEPIWDGTAKRYKPWTGDAPVVLKLKARLVPQWTMNGANAGPVPLSPVAAAGPLTTVELIPYGSSRLRIAEFPVAP